MKGGFYPKNKKQFLELKIFASEILEICDKIKVKPILYGSFMIFQYTKNKNLKVNDIDFYIREKDFEKLSKALKNKKINFEYPKKWHTLQASKGKLKIEFDSIDFWNKAKKEFIEIDFGGRKIK